MVRQSGRQLAVNRSAEPGGDARFPWPADGDWIIIHFMVRVSDQKPGGFHSRGGGGGAPSPPPPQPERLYSVGLVHIWNGGDGLWTWQDISEGSWPPGSTGILWGHGDCLGMGAGQEWIVLWIIFAVTNVGRKCNLALPFPANKHPAGK